MNWNIFSSTQCEHQMESSSTVECCLQNIIFNSYSGSNQLFFNKKVECSLQTIIFHSCRSQLLWSTQWKLSVNYYMKQYMYVNLPYKAYGVSWGAKHKNSQVCRELEVLIGSDLQRFQHGGMAHHNTAHYSRARHRSHCAMRYRAMPVSGAVPHRYFAIMNVHYAWLQKCQTWTYSR